VSGTGGRDPGPQSFLPQLSGLLLGEETVSGLLGIIVNLATSAVTGVDGASVSLLLRNGERLETTSASSEVIRTVDERQYEGGGGPCVEAIRTGEETSIVLPTDRWPIFGELAERAGMHSVWSLPLKVRDRTTGALNLYSAGVEGVGGSSVETSRLLAREASVVLANAAALMSAELANHQLREALITRDMIGQAKGILMIREGLSADEAFDVMRRASGRTNRKLREIAADIVGGVGRRPEAS
jgi:GAF domain-containing protein